MSVEIYDINTDTFKQVPDHSAQAIADRRVAALAKRVQNNRQFASIVKAAKPASRQAIYSEIKPHLSFKPMSFKMLMLLAPNK